MNNPHPRPFSTIAHPSKTYRIFGLFCDPQIYLLEILIRKLIKLNQKKESFEFYILNESDYEYLFKNLKRQLPDRSICIQEKGAPIIIEDYIKFIKNICEIQDQYQNIYNSCYPLYKQPDIITIQDITNSINMMEFKMNNYFNSSFVYMVLQTSSIKNSDIPGKYLKTLRNIPKQFKIIIELYKAKQPKSARLFEQLCANQYLNQGYKGAQIDRLCKNYFFQAGNHNLKSIVFADECKYAQNIKHDRPGIVGFTNFGKSHSNTFSFYITLNKVQGFDGKNVIIGQVIKGMKYLRKINKIQPQGQQQPLVPIQIIESGTYILDKADFELNEQKCQKFKDSVDTQHIEMRQSQKYKSSINYSMVKNSATQREIQQLQKDIIFSVKQGNLFQCDQFIQQSEDSMILSSANISLNIQQKEDDGLGDYLNQVVPQMCESLYTSQDNFFKEKSLNASKQNFFESSKINNQSEKSISDVDSVYVSYLSGF